MEDETIKKSTEEFEQALREFKNQKYVLRLYVMGQTPKSLRAVKNIEQICREHLQGYYELEVVDLREHPDRAESDRILAVPVLIKQLPIPLRQYIGDMSDTEKIIVGLGLLPKDVGA